MEDSSVYQRNPWEDDDRSLGSIKHLLYMAQKTGHLKQRVRLDCEQQYETTCNKYASMKMIAVLKNMDGKKKQIEQSGIEIQRRLQDKETSDITHLHKLEKRIAEINDLSSHIQKIVASKDQLIGRLQQPFVGDFIKMEASNHKFACEVLPMLVPVLSDLTAHLDNIEWASQVDVNDDKMDLLLSEISASLASLQSTFQSLAQMRQVTRDIHSQRCLHSS